VEIKLGVRTANCEFGKGTDCDIKPFTELVPVAVEDNEVVGIQTN
jgi:hypothetical protein